MTKSSASSLPDYIAIWALAQGIEAEDEEVRRAYRGLKRAIERYVSRVEDSRIVQPPPGVAEKAIPGRAK